jgi:chitodextrinase
VANVGGFTKTGSLAARGGGGGGGGGGVNVAPILTAIVPSTALTGVDVVFDASGSNDTDGKIVSWIWSFGDGASGSGARTSHRFANAGSYKITLTLTDDLGATAKSEWTLKVEKPPNRLPIANAGSDRRVFVNGVVDLDGSSSLDPDGTFVSFSWDFGDGSSGAGTQVQHSYSNAGEYEVVLSVVDADGAVATNSLFITVEAPPITPSIVNTSTLTVGENVINASQSGLPIIVELNSTAPVSLSLFKYPSNPYPGSPLPLESTGVFFDISVSNPDAVDWPIYMELAVGSHNSDTLGLYYYDGSAWVACSTTGYDSDRGVIWAWIASVEAAGSPLMIGEVKSDSNIRVSDLRIFPVNVVSGTPVKVSITLYNLGSVLVSYPIVVLVNGVGVVEENVSLSAGEVKVIEYTISETQPDTYYVEVLGLTESFTVSPTPKPADIVLVSFAVNPNELVEGGRVNVTATFRNVGELSGERLFVVGLNGLKAISQTVSLQGGEEITLTASLTLEVAGTNIITLAGESRSVEVVSVEVEEPEETDIPWNIVYPVVVMVCTPVIVYLILRRKR